MQLQSGKQSLLIYWQSAIITLRTVNEKAPVRHSGSLNTQNGYIRGLKMFSSTFRRRQCSSDEYAKKSSCSIAFCGYVIGNSVV